MFGRLYGDGRVTSFTYSLQDLYRPVLKLLMPPTNGFRASELAMIGQIDAPPASVGVGFPADGDVDEPLTSLIPIVSWIRILVRPIASKTSERQLRGTKKL